MSHTVFGIRHHGPGSARSLRRALSDLEPDAVLVEGPPEADALVALAGHEEMRPPVALLGYSTTDVGRASFWPMAVFSPEWTAIQYGLAAAVPVRFFDLPMGYRLGRRTAQRPASTEDTPDEESEEEPAPSRPADPLGLLAEAAGYDDPERWWEDMVEHRREGGSPFEAIAEAMTAVRSAVPGGPADAAGGDTRDEVREAYMRTVLRATIRAGRERIAVVCGAWHVPALTGRLPPATHDAALLKGLRKEAITMTWVPWTHGRLASWQGYGAGVVSPGWYHHLFTAPDRVVERWLVGVAAVLRAQDLPVSSAHVIEAVRLAEALATLRGRPLPGLAEVTEATRAVLCDGDPLRLDLVQREVVVGELIGTVPAQTPSVPLARDLAAAQKRLRLPPDPVRRELDLDLRKENDRARSYLLHRLALLGVDWGVPAGRAGRQGLGTFWESWQLAWAPEYEVALIAASGYGTTVAAAAGARVVEQAGEAAELATVTSTVERCLLASLEDALPAVLEQLTAKAALAVDVAHLMDALPALARSLRYGDVRATDTSALDRVVSGLAVRIRVGLPRALSLLDDDAAVAMRRRLDAVHAALKTLDEAELFGGWLDTLAAVADRDDLPGLIGGRLARLLHDEGRLSTAEVARRMAMIVTVGVGPARTAAWVEGFLAGGGLLLAHDDALLGLVDGWLTGIAPDTFLEVLPLLRRTFATFELPQRRAIGERVRRGTASAGGSGAAGDELAELDPERVALILPTLRLLLGGGGPA